MFSFQIITIAEFYFKKRQYVGKDIGCQYQIVPTIFPPGESSKTGASNLESRPIFFLTAFPFLSYSHSALQEALIGVSRACETEVKALKKMEYPY
jgi:hypothetical protein